MLDDVLHWESLADDTSSSGGCGGAGNTGPGLIPRGVHLQHHINTRLACLRANLTVLGQMPQAHVRTAVDELSKLAKQATSLPKAQGMHHWHGSTSGSAGTGSTSCPPCTWILLAGHCVG